MKGVTRFGLILAAIAVLAAAGACAPKPAATPQPTAAPVALVSQRGEFFSAAADCAFCHTGLKDAAGTDVSIDSDWRSSMMANSTRDPYYRASVRSEVLAYPEFNDVIQDKCTVCHVGMAYQTASFTGETIHLVGDDGFMNADHPLHNLAIDGVSCTLCHQIEAGNLGEESSFSGGYQIDSTTPAGSRAIYGQFAVDSANSAVMSGTSGYTPAQSEHILQSETCAVCHNLFTPYITNDGELSDELFPEQTPQLEYQHSAYPGTQTCQTCHMPAASGAVAIANTGSPAREPFGQHILAGGNLFMVNLFSNNAQALNASANSDHFAVTAQQISDQLTQRTATLNLKAEQNGAQLTVDAAIQILTGHKFPTSFPSRRAWLHLTILDGKQQVIFESGGWNADGSIVGNANDADAAQFEPHYTEINAADQVQIYEPIIGDPNGQVTTNLLRAKDYLKDNRLLPLGFEKTTADPVIAVAGAALQDANFIAGGDTTRYLIDTGAYTGPFTIKAELLYQSIGFRWSEKFRSEADNPEGAEFYSYLENTPLIPVVISSAETTLP